MGKEPGYSCESGGKLVDLMGIDTPNAFTEGHRYAEQYEQMINELPQEGVDEAFLQSCIGEIDQQTGHMGELMRVSGYVIRRTACGIIDSEQAIGAEGVQATIGIHEERVFVEDELMTSCGYYIKRLADENGEMSYRLYHLAIDQIKQSFSYPAASSHYEQHYYLLPIDQWIDVQPATPSREPNLALLEMFADETMHEIDEALLNANTKADEPADMGYMLRQLGGIKLRGEADSKVRDHLSVELARYAGYLLDFDEHGLYGVEVATRKPIELLRGDQRIGNLQPTGQRMWLSGRILGVCLMPLEEMATGNKHEIERSFGLQMEVPADEAQWVGMVVPLEGVRHAAKYLQVPIRAASQKR